MDEHQSRQQIRATLRGTVVQVKRQVKRAVQRWLPIEPGPELPPHRAYIRADGDLCCERHAAQFEASARLLRRW
jgi:hypothetical protein